MEKKQLIEISKDNLSRVLGFFPRVDTLLSVLLALNLGATAVLASNAPPVQKLDGYVWIAMLYLIFVVISFYHLYKSAFPRLDGGVTSLLYFREVANKTEIEYFEAFNQQTEDSYLTDLNEQMWRNSTILKDKYHHLKMAFIFLLLSLVFWLPALLIFVSKHTESFLNK